MRPLTVIMAKRPIAGHAKTRLVAPGFLDSAGAAELAEAILQCTVERLAASGDLVLAVTPDGSACDEWPRFDCEHAAGRIDVIDQGSGDLGARIDRVWRQVARDRSVAFFGTDTPDVPDESIMAIGSALCDADVAVGPTSDGGYWTLAARTYRPALLTGIDWGEETVYDQTCRRAEEAGLTLRSLPPWHDVDLPADVLSLRRRLVRLLSRVRPPESGDDAPFRRLLHRINLVLGPTLLPEP